MSLSSIVRRAVAIADKTTKSLQDTITFEAWIGFTDAGGPEYDSAISILAIIEEKQVLRRLASGQEVMQKATITIPRAVAANGAAERREPIDPRDRITLPSGYTGPILDVSGVTDPLTHRAYMYQVVLG